MRYSQAGMWRTTGSLTPFNATHKLAQCGVWVSMLYAFVVFCILVPYLYAQTQWLNYSLLIFECLSKLVFISLFIANCFSIQDMLWDHELKHLKTCCVYCSTDYDLKYLIKTNFYHHQKTFMNLIHIYLMIVPLWKVTLGLTAGCSPVFGILNMARLLTIFESQIIPFT